MRYRHRPRVLHTPLNFAHTVRDSSAARLIGYRRLSSTIGTRHLVRRQVLRERDDVPNSADVIRMAIVWPTMPVSAQLLERPLISGRHAVVTSGEPLASIAGMRILQEGGNAFDAAMATAQGSRSHSRLSARRLTEGRRGAEHAGLSGTFLPDIRTGADRPDSALSPSTAAELPPLQV